MWNVFISIWGLRLIQSRNFHFTSLRGKASRLPLAFWNTNWEGERILGFLLLNSLCSVGFYQMAKIAVTPTIVFSEFILFKKTISFKKVPTKQKNTISIHRETCLLPHYVLFCAGIGFVCRLHRCCDCNRNRFRVQPIRRLDSNCLDNPKCHKQNTLVESATTSELDGISVSSCCYYFTFGLSSLPIE